MYQGVFTQCRGVAHNSRFSVFPQSAESFLFTFQCLHLWGIISIPILVPNSVVCTYGASFHPNSQCFGALLYHFNAYINHICCFVMRHLPSHLANGWTLIFNGAFILPILGCFHCTLHLPSLWGVSIHTGHLSIPFNFLPI